MTQKKEKKMEVNREMSVTFPLPPNSGSINNKHVLDCLKDCVSEKDIKCIQLTRTSCNITLKNEGSKTDLKLKGITINSKHVRVIDVDSQVTNVIIKDLPTEVNEAFVTAHLARYGQPVQGTLERKFITGTDIENGTRAIKLLNVKETIPNETKWGRFSVRLYCDNGKSACVYCGSCAHLHYQCTDRRMAQEDKRKCFSCGKLGHLKVNCPQTASHQPPTHQTEQVTAFRGDSNPLSNLYRLEAPITIKKKEFPTLEHGYKAMKARHYGRDDIVPIILKMEKALDVMKFVGKELKETNIDLENIEEWKLQRKGVMKKLLTEKYRQSATFRKALHSSKDILVEATSHPFWASGIGGIPPTLATDPTEWPGKNMLGRLLAELRTEYLNDWQDEINSRPEAQQLGEHLAPNLESITTMIQQQRSVVNQTSEAAPDDDPKTKDDDKEGRQTEQDNASETETEADIEESEEGQTVEDESEQEEVNPQCTLIIGDSLLAGTKTDASVKLVTKSGATFRDMEDLLLSSRTTVEDTEVVDVVIALGTNDLKNTGNVSGTILQLQQAVATTIESFPEADIYMSSIPHRHGSPKVVSGYNKLIDQTNNFMSEFAKQQKRIHFIKNYSIFESSKGQLCKIYDVSDKLGVHLTNQGKQKLVQNILQSVISVRSKVTPVKGRIKRFRSENTPPSVEKGQKSQRI